VAPDDSRVGVDFGARVKEFEVTRLIETVLAGSSTDVEVARDREDELAETEGSKVMTFGGEPLDEIALPVIVASRVVEELSVTLLDVSEAGDDVVCADAVSDRADVAWAEPLADFDSAAPFPSSELGHKSFTPAEERLDPRMVVTYPGEHSNVKPSKAVVTLAVQRAEQPLSKSFSEQFGMDDRYALLQAVGSDDEGAESPRSAILTARTPGNNEQRIKVADIFLNPISTPSQADIWLYCCSVGSYTFVANVGLLVQFHAIMLPFQTSND
jgi:hypothetical protein